SATMPPDFITQAVHSFNQNKKIAFCCSAIPASPSEFAPRLCSIPGVLNGREITFPIIFRTSSVKHCQEFDSAFADSKAAQWELCIRLIEQEQLGVIVPSQNAPSGELKTVLWTSECVSGIYAAHAALFQKY